MKSLFGKYITEYLRFYKMGLIQIPGLAIYLGILGLYLIIVDNNYISSLALFIAALLISPTHGDIKYDNQTFQHRTFNGIKIRNSHLAYFIAWWQLGF